MRTITRNVCSLAALAVASHAQSLHGSGTTNPSKFFWKIMDMFKASSTKDIKMTYRAVGSGTGQKEFSQKALGNFFAPLTDFGSGDIPMPNSLYTSINATRGMVHVPFSLGAIGVFHSVPPAAVGNAGLKLSACVLAKIFSGQVTTWDHADIKADNPSLSVPAGTPIKVGRRTLGSSSTGGLSGYLTAKCRADWKMVGTGAPMGDSGDIAWPTLATFTKVEGSPGMLDHIAGTPYAIGYLDAGHGHQRRLAEAKLKNEDGTWLTSAEALAKVDASGNNGVAAAGKAAVDAGAIPPQPTDDFSGVNLYSKAGPNTWPIVLVSYIYLPKDISGWAADKASLLKAFMDYVTGPDGQKMLPDFSFNAIPAAMNKWSATWDLMTKPDAAQLNATKFTFENSTEPWVGQGPQVISSKRTTYSMWVLEEMDIALKAAVARLSAIESSMSDFGLVPLHGSGTTNPKNWFAKAMKTMEHQARVQMLLTYRAVGSGTGQQEFVGDAASGYKAYSHYGSGDIPMSAANFAKLASASPARTMLHLPFALGAIGIFHGVPGDELGAAELKLDACLLAKIFSGKITTWDHADIKAQNPGISVPAGTKIKVGHRTLGSSSTGGVAGYLNKKCPAEWTLGDGSTVAWPQTADFKAVQGSPGMQAHIRDTKYSIGYLDAGHGHDFALAEVALKNADGETRTSKASMALGGVASAGSQAISSNAFPADATADWSAVNVYDMPGKSTWPIVLVSYLYVDKDQSSTNPKTAAALKAFIDYILNNRDGLCEEFGFTAPSKELKDKSLAAAGTVVYPSGMQSFTFETDTDAYAGMGDAVISSKRFAFDDYERSVLKEDIEKLKAAVQTVAPGAPAPAPQKEADEGTDASLIVSIIAIILSVLSICLGTFALLKPPKGGKDTAALATTYGNAA